MLACYGVSSMVPKKQATTSLVVGKVIEFTTAQSLRNDFESKDLFIKNRSKHNSVLVLRLLRFFMNKSLVYSVFQPFNLRLDF